MKPAKTLKKVAVDNPKQIGREDNLRAVRHHLENSSETDRAFAADAAVKLANADPHAAQKIRQTLEEVAYGSAPRTVTERARAAKERAQRALQHIDSQVDAKSSATATVPGEADPTGNKNTQVYHRQDSASEQNYCSACGTKLPSTGPNNFCPGCGAEVS